jgi:hypothetical protein
MSNSVKVELLKACGVAGKSCKAGDVVDVSAADARYLKSVGKAKDVQSQSDNNDSEGAPNLKKMNKAQLIEVAKELGIEELSGTNAELIEAIEALANSEDDES